MMFPNSNKAVLGMLTKRSLRANRTRNRFVILAILLTTWLITSFFSIGISYTKTIQAENLKLAGTTAEATLTSPTEQQLDKLQTLSYIRQIGLESKVGDVINTLDTGNLRLSLRWVDPGGWNRMRLPSIDNLKGGYPHQEDEIAVPLWILDLMGIKNPKEGMILPLSYTTLQEGVKSQHSSQFVLSGWFKEYSHIRNGSSGELLVSEALAQRYGAGPQQPGMVSIMFKHQGDNDELVARLSEDLDLQAGQKVLPNRPMMSGSSDQLSTLAGYGGIILFVMLSGYLLIYNVLYISVSRDTRYYGLLKTIGMTKRQIVSIVRGQAMRLALVAIPLGLLAGAVTSFAVVPLALGTMSVETGAEISFHPVIFIGTALFAWITTWLGCLKPASIAGKVSPVEAIKYTGNTVKTKSKQSTDGSKLHRLALRNIFRIRKRAVVVFLSLFMGLSTFLIVTTIVISMDTDNLVAQYMEHDFVLENQTMSLGYEGDADQLKITGDMVAELGEMKGITAVYPVYGLFGRMTYDAEVFGKYMDNFAATYHFERPSDKELTAENGRFSGTHISGLDHRQAKELAKKLGIQLDMERFVKGETALLDDMHMGGIAAGGKLQLSMLDGSRRAVFEIGGVGDFSSLVSFHTTAPNVYVSHEGFRKLQENPLIEKVYINTRQEAAAEQISEELKSLIGRDTELKLESRLDLQAELESTKWTLYILGGGIGLMLALIGLLNFVNLMYTGVLARKLEFAVMESIGMTSRQMKKLLLFEGLGYAVISTALISTVGTLLSYGIFSLFVKEADYAVFSFPFVPLGIAIMLVFAVCLTVPLVAYRQINRASIVERLRERE